MLLLVLTRRKERTLGTRPGGDWLENSIYRGPLPTAAGGEARGTGSAASPSFGTTLDSGWLRDGEEKRKNSGNEAGWRLVRKRHLSWPLPTAAGERGVWGAQRPRRLVATHPDGCFHSCLSSLLVNHNSLVVLRSWRSAFGSHFYDTSRC